MFLRIPKVRMAIVLFALSLLALVRFFSFELLLRFAVIVSFTLVLEYVLWRIRKIEPFLPSAGIVSALIIFLLADYTTPMLLIFIAILAAVGIKQFVRPSRNHVLNPAASGLFTAGIFGLPISWWGVSWGVIPMVITILGAGYVSLVTIRQHRIVIPFILVTFIASLLLFGNFTDPIRAIMVGSFWFFTLVMLPEPMTAARFPKSRIFYGALVAVLPFLLAQVTFFPDTLVVSLLIGNATARVLEENGIGK